MFIRTRETVKRVDWGNGDSYRLLVADDGMGFTVCHTVVHAGTSSKLQYRKHLEACYCISGKGEVVTSDGVTHPIEPGVLYALDQHDAHTLTAAASEDLHLISVFNPPLSGEEKHSLCQDGYSCY